MKTGRFRDRLADAPAQEYPNSLMEVASQILFLLKKLIAADMSNNFKE